MKIHEELFEIMVDGECSLREALEILFQEYRVDTTSVLDITDFLESRFSNLDYVSQFMDIYLGKTTDLVLRKLDEKKKTD